jgi:TPR repeat protein
LTSDSGGLTIGVEVILNNSYFRPYGCLSMNLRLLLVRVILVCAIAVAAQMSWTQTQDISVLHKQAKEGNAEAQFKLANAYLRGEGVSQDSKQAVEWFRKAADLGHPVAEFTLAYMYLKGAKPSIDKDPRQGLDWLQRSAGHGYAPAQYNLGLLYRDGDSETGVARKPHEAAAWFRKAARQTGSVRSQTSLKEMLQQGLISKQEANWSGAESATEVKPAKSTAFSLSEVEKGLQGGITCKRLEVLIDKYKVDFALTTSLRERLGKDGADDSLLKTIAASKSRPM